MASGGGAARSGRQGWFGAWGCFFVPLLAGAGLSFAVVMPSAGPDPDPAAPEVVHATCDRAVAALLESRDPVELQRADILIGTSAATSGDACRMGLERRGERPALGPCPRRPQPPS